MMKVILINGSPRPRGCTYTALKEVEKILNEENIETEIIHIGHKNIRGCIGCRKCKEIGKCIFKDCVNDIALKFQQSDGLIIGTPVYYASANGTLVSFLDRLFFSTQFDKSMKVGATVVSARRGGNSVTFDEINKYFTCSSMPLVSSQYWNSVHGNSPEEVYRDKEGMQTMRLLGKNTAFLIKSIDYGKKEFGIPQNEKRILTSFIQ